MKKINAVLAMILFLISGVFAQVKNLVVEKPFDSYSSGVYEYRGKYNNKNYWIGPKNVDRKVISFSKNYSRWEFADWYGDTSQMFGWAEDQSTSTDAYPTAGWSRYKVSIEGPTLKYDITQLLEGRSNDGSLNESITISFNKLDGYSFAGNVGSDLVASNALSLDRLPAGLTAQAMLLSDSTVELYFSGNALNHEVDTNIVVSFKDAAFTNGGKADSIQNTTTTIKIDWVNMITVAPSGGDFTSIQKALGSIEDSDILYIKEGVYTESNLATAFGITNLTILGDGPDKTIVQADTAPFIAKDRVFNLNSLAKAYIEGITIQNGNVVQNNASGGGIALQSAATEMVNCRILNNRAFSTTIGQTVAGGVFSRSIIMKNCEVSGNICDNGGKKGQVYGGGIVTQDFRNGSKLENTTFANNFSRNGGGAFGNFQGNLEVVNCTFKGNATADSGDAQGLGGAIWSQDTVFFYNSICWDNKGNRGKDIYISNGKLITSNSILSSYSNWDTATATNLIGTFSKEDPMLDTLAFNCSVTRTFALLEGSPAIDAADEKYASTSTDQRGYDMLEKRDMGAHESNNIIRFEIESAGDTLCLDEEVTPITLAGYPSNGIFEGAGVSGNTFDVSKITEEGWVKITYKFSAPGCENIQVVDSVYAKVCKVNNTQNIELTVRMYPNPVQSVLHFDLNASDVMDIQIMDISGKLVHGVSQVSPKTAVNVADLPNGLYFVKVVSGGRSAHMKFIKN